jgi:V-type H+-transporting ATPase subunit C
MALMHLKVMRAYIDGVLRFGIPPKFFLGIVKPTKGKEKQVLSSMTDVFIDPTLKDMYGSKEDAQDTEDFFPFVMVPLTSPIFL